MRELQNTRVCRRLASLTLGALLATTTLLAAVPTAEFVEIAGVETGLSTTDTIGLPPAVPNQQSPAPEPADPSEDLREKRAPSQNIHYVVSETTTLHRGPNGNTAVLAEIMAGDAVTVKSKKYKFWWQVETGNYEGWINSVLLLPAELLEEVEGESVEPLASRSMPTAAPEGEFTQKGLPAAALSTEFVAKAPTPVYTEVVDTWYSVTQPTSFRTGPSSKNKVLRRLSNKDQLSLVEKTNNFWWKMTWDGQTGYVKAALLEASGEKPVEPVLESPVVTVKSPEPAAPTVEPLTVPDGAFYFAPADATIQEASPKSEPSIFYDAQFEIVQRTSLRQTPNSQAPVLTRLGEGDAVTIVEKTNRYWWKVSYGNLTGYAKAHLLEEL